jgi:flagellar hook-associated protein 2
MSTSSTSASILSALSSSGLGLGQGIDVSGTVSQIIAGLRAPEQVWQTQQKMLEGQVSALTQLNTEVSALGTAVNSLSDPAGAMTARTVSSSDPTLVTASASNATPAGSHTVVVTSLATSSSYYSSSVATSSTALATGTFTIQVGSGKAATVTIDSTDNTLDGLAAAINGQNLGVSASVINDSSGSRLSLVSSNSGAASDLTVSNVAGGLSFTKGVTGADAKLTVDGVPISSASNTVTGTASGLTLNLVGSDPTTPVQVVVAADTSQVSQTITNFVDAYNTVVQDLNSQFTYNTTTKSAGTLAGDSGARLVQDQLLTAVTYNAGGTGPINTLADLGISMNNDGTLSIDSTTLDSAVNSNFAAVQTFFQPASGSGFAQVLNNQLTALTDPTQGAFTVEINGLNASDKSFQDQIDNFEVYIASEQTLLTAQYTQVDLALQQLPMLQQQINAELGYTNTNSSSSK